MSEQKKHFRHIKDLVIKKYGLDNFGPFDNLYFYVFSSCAPQNNLHVWYQSLGQSIFSTMLP